MGRAARERGNPVLRGVRLPKKQIVIPERVAARAATRFFVADNGCHISTYSVASHGYAQIGWQDKRYRQVVTAHRASWVYSNGQIPEGMTIDHICRTRRCVNPKHLRLMSNLDNARGGGGLHLQKPKPTGKSCARGHAVLEFTNGDKHCRECNQEWARRKRARQLAARAKSAA